MVRLFRPLFLVLAGITHRELAKVVDFLQEENRILRSKLPERVQLAPAERARLVKRGQPLGDKIRDVISIVTPRTFARWISGEAKPGKPAKIGRPRKPVDLRELVLKIANETGWGYERILGELKKLKVGPICRTTVRNILLEAGHEPSPKGRKETWNDFVASHSQTLWQCDFFSKKVFTKCGLIEYFVFFFIHVDTRRVYLAGMTPNPTHDWVSQQARNFAMYVEDSGLPSARLIRDNDGKFCEGFDDALAASGIETVKIPPRSPYLNAYAERFVRTIKEECLDRFIVLGERHLRYLIGEFIAHYHTERPHQGLGNVPLGAPRDGPSAGEIVCHERLGGVLKHYARRAA